MTNLSGKKRQQMLEFLEKIKEGLSDETSLSTVRDIEEVWPGGRTDTITFWREIICTA